MACLDSFLSVIVKPRGFVFVLEEVIPIGNSVTIEVGIDISGCPKPAELGLPEPKVVFRAGLRIEPFHFGMINPSARIGKEGAEPR